jgi:hypothetical protein
MSAVYVAVGSAVVGGLSALDARKRAKRARKEAANAKKALKTQADQAVEVSRSLGEQQLNFQRQQYEDMAPLARRASESQLAAQEEQMRQGRDYYDYMTSTFRPLEQGLVRSAQQFDSDAYREQLAQQAAADAATAFGNVQGQTERRLAGLGVSPGSGAAMSQMNQNALALASARSGAMTGARRDAEETGFRRQMEVSGLGRGLGASSLAAYGGASGAGTAGIQTGMMPGAAYGQGISSAANIRLAGTGQALGAYGSMYSGAQNAAAAAQSDYMGAVGSLVGMGGNIAAGNLNPQPAVQPKTP